MEIYLNNFTGYISVTLEQPVVIRVDTRTSINFIEVYAAKKQRLGSDQSKLHAIDMLGILPLDYISGIFNF